MPPVSMENQHDGATMPAQAMTTQGIPTSHELSGTNIETGISAKHLPTSRTDASNGMQSTMAHLRLDKQMPGEGENQNGEE